MEFKFIPNFKLYDQLAYIMVGSIALLVVTYDLFILRWPFRIPGFDAQSFIIYLIVTYFAGHVCHAVANILLRETKTGFSESEKEILEKAKQLYQLDKQSDHEIYLICYLHSTAKDLTGQVELFNAYYSLYRGWFVVFVFESIFLIFLHIVSSFSYAYLISLILAIILTVLFYRRAKRFFRYSQAKTLQNFIIINRGG